MEERIFGRKKEKNLLSKIYHSKSPAFIALYGRRRVGKTYLIKEYFQEKGTFFHITGIKDAKTSFQLDHFCWELQEVFGRKDISIKNWTEAFILLRQQIQDQQEKVILFFDELPWLASPRSGFLQALDHFWNRYLSSMDHVILIVCGSAASWMINKVLNSRGGLHGRITHEIPLFPFDLEETKSFLENRNISMNLHQIVELYFAIGGVAKYLTYVERGLSSAQIIDQLCFTRHGPLVKEFYRLYESLFSHAENHITIIRELAKKKSGLTYKELAKKISISTGGSFSKRLLELQTSGFIDTISTFGKGKRDVKYVLIDEFSLFYITWMENLRIDETPHYWMRQNDSSKYTAWKGFAFERLCMKHLTNIKTALGIASIITKTSKWSSDGAEIDWVIDRSDQCINLFEAKFVTSEFEIKKSYADTLRKKKHLFQEMTKTRKTLFTTMLTPYGVKENQHYFETIDQQIILADLFKSVL